MSNEPTMQQIDARLGRIESALGIVAALATRKLSREQQAKLAGCSVSTLQRREREARAKLLAEGIDLGAIHGGAR